MFGTAIVLALLTSRVMWVGIIYLFLQNPLLFLWLAFLLAVVLGALIYLRNHLGGLAPVIEDHP